MSFIYYIYIIPHVDEVWGGWMVDDLPGWALSTIPHRKERRNGASLKDLIGTIHINKVHLPFREPVRRNYKVKRACLGEIQGWVTSWEDSPRKRASEDKARWKGPVLVCGGSRQIRALH